MGRINVDHDKALLIQRYVKETEGVKYTIEEIHKRPYWKQIWFLWKAKEKYEGFNIEFTMDEVRKIYGE